MINNFFGLIINNNFVLIINNNYFLKINKINNIFFNNML